jgi:hypothetical protein
VPRDRAIVPLIVGKTRPDNVEPHTPSTSTMR